MYNTRYKKHDTQRFRVACIQGRSQHGAIAPQSWALPPPPQSGLAPATVVSLRLAMGQLRLEKCIKTRVTVLGFLPIVAK